MNQLFAATIFSFLLFANSSCDKCEDTACFSPPSEFAFQLVDKDSGEDLVINGTFNANEISIYSVAKQQLHQINHSDSDTSVLFFDAEIGWETGPENRNYEIRLGSAQKVIMVYETSEGSEGCCTFFEMVEFSVDSIETSYSDQTNVLQLKI